MAVAKEFNAYKWSCFVGINDFFGYHIIAQHYLTFTYGQDFIVLFRYESNLTDQVKITTAC